MCSIGANIQIFLNKSCVFHKFNTFSGLAEADLAEMALKMCIFAVKIRVRFKHVIAM